MERFWSKVDRRGPDECWPWLAYKTRLGYGRFRYRGKSIEAPRIAYFLTHGFESLLPEQVVRHTCDNPTCVNPAHLLPGTSIDNVRDRDERGRTNHPRGERNIKAKISVEAVSEIRQRYCRAKTGGWGKPTQAELAYEYGLSQGQISKIVLGQSWGGD